MRISDWSSDVCSSDLIGFSALLALTLTPALCATFLKPHVPENHRKENWLTRRTGRFFTGFNNWFGRTTDRYQGGVARILSRPLRWLAIFIALVGLTVILFSRLPGGFLPQEDPRSEERRVGKGGVSTCRARGAP